LKTSKLSALTNTSLSVNAKEDKVLTCKESVEKCMLIVATIHASIFTWETVNMASIVFFLTPSRGKSSNQNPPKKCAANFITKIIVLKATNVVSLTTFAINPVSTILWANANFQPIPAVFPTKKRSTSVYLVFLTLWEDAKTNNAKINTPSII